MELQHPLEKGTLVRVNGRKKLWTVSRPIYDKAGSELEGYELMDPKMAMRAIRVGEIRPR